MASLFLEIEVEIGLIVKEDTQISCLFNLLVYLANPLVIRSLLKGVILALTLKSGMTRGVVVVVGGEDEQTDEERIERISSSIKEELATLLSHDPADFPLVYNLREWNFVSDWGTRYLDLFPKRRVDVTSAVDRFVMAMMGVGHTNLLERASQFYHINDWSCIDLVEFVKKRLIESCFVIELFRKYAMKELRDPNDPMFNTPESLLEVRRDLIYHYDHYPPFFVLVEFFNVTKIQDDPRDNLIDLALLFFENLVGHPLKPSPNIQIREIKHLTDLIHKALSVPVAAETSITMEAVIELQYINYATELEEAGVKFKRMKGNNLEIKFQNGILEIPPIKVAENTTLFLLEELMAYERNNFQDPAPRNVNDYVKFIRCLINSPKDVELLRRGGIIENWLGNDQLILGKLIELDDRSKISRNFTYYGIFKKVHEHCGHRRNIWMAKLWRNYFNSPWSFISFFAAVVLLLLTLTQTVFSILSYHPS